MADKKVTDLYSSRTAAAVVPHDVNVIPATRKLYIGTVGDVKVVLQDNIDSGIGDVEEPVTFVAVPAGTILPVRAVKVLATGTTATNIVAMY